MFFHNNDFFKGYWSPGLEELQGEYYKAYNQRTYRGIFNLNNDTGEGTVTFKNGFVYEGKWFEGRTQEFG